MKDKNCKPRILHQVKLAFKKQVIYTHCQKRKKNLSQHTCTTRNAKGNSIGKREMIPDQTHIFGKE